MTELVLIGAGHAHAFVLEAFSKAPVPGVAITLITPQRQAAYSGHVPAWLAGECRFSEMTIDFEWLAQRANARLILDSVDSITASDRRLRLASGAWVDFDIASINTGSTLKAPTLNAHSSMPRLLSMRPLAALDTVWASFLGELSAWPADSPRRIVAVGGGAAGCETLLAVQARLRAERPDIDWQATLIGASSKPLGQAGRLPAHLLQRELRSASVQWVGNRRVQAVVGGGVEDDLGQHYPADVVLWATGALGHEWLQSSDIALDERGFIPVESTLAVRGQAALFAAGDCAGFDPALPNAGVFAVRMGPVLADNLRRACQKKPLMAWRPPRRVLALIGTGHGRAIASRGALGVSGRWVWRWKRRIDQRFIARFNPKRTQ
jgi:pyridine nucleotide-disulfide oxidoreductase family protein|tara:strand:- start:5418 stop:6554 length:1137 start_codon:yes stop_codon:yes gene_type:complete